MFNQLLLINFKQQKVLNTTATELSLGIGYLHQLCVSTENRSPDLEVLKEFDLLKVSKIGASIT